MGRPVSGPAKTAEGRGAAEQQCPFLQSCTEAHGYPLLGYCLAYQDGRLRAVTIAEFRDYCTGPAYRRCQTYQVRVAQEAADAA